MSKCEKVVLHAGLDKTGSTAIQSFLDARREFLLDAYGIAYLPGRWQARLGSFFSERPQNFILNKLQKLSDINVINTKDKAYVDEINNWLQGIKSPKIIVASYEGFPSLEVDSLENLKSFFLEKADKIEVVLYVRPPFSYAVSAMSQDIKHGFRPKTKVKPVISIISKFVNVFGRSNVYVQPYERSNLIDNDIVADFLSRFLGVYLREKTAVSKKENENKSLSHYAVRYGEFLLDAALKYYVTEVIENPNFYHRFVKYMETITGPKVRLTESQLEEVKQEFKPHAEYLKREFGIVFRESASDFIIEDRDKISRETEELLREIAEMHILKERDLRPNNGYYKGSLLCELDELQAIMGEKITVDVVLKNESINDWFSDEKKPLRLAYHIRDDMGNTVVFGGRRTALPISKINAQSELITEMVIMAPVSPGQYQVELALVKENEFWLESDSFYRKTLVLHVSD